MVTFWSQEKRQSDRERGWVKGGETNDDDDDDFNNDNEDDDDGNDDVNERPSAKKSKR